MKPGAITSPARRWTWLRYCAAAFSGLLLAIAFEPFGDDQAAWFAFVPLLLVLYGLRPPRAFRTGFVFGFVFWLMNISWLLRLGATGVAWPVAVIAWVMLAAYCSLYAGAFCAVAAPLLAAATDARRRVAATLALPLLWVGFEYLRARLFTGFAWNPVGVSQYHNLTVIQVASLGGVYAVSALVVLMNVAVTMMAQRFIDLYRRRGGSERFRPELMVALGILALCLAHGVRTRTADSGAVKGPAVAIRAVQPNIVQEKKWREGFVDNIYATLQRETEYALIGREEIDLIIWPETALPAPVRTDAEAFVFVDALAKKGVPLLVGSLELEQEDGWVRYYNSSFLFDGEGALRGTYRKQHLVPFGEYVPFEHQILWLGQFAPLGFSCWPGSTGTVFRLDEPATAFSSLICFEDTMPRLARRAVLGGARFLVNQTNDAWFDGSAAARQHMSHCVLRCVENRVDAVRVANTGVTCFIDRAGKVSQIMEQPDGSTRFAGFTTHEIQARGDDEPLTLYTRYGDLPFALPCGIAAALAFVLVGIREKREYRHGTFKGNAVEENTTEEEPDDN